MKKFNKVYMGLNLVINIRFKKFVDLNDVLDFFKRFYL